MPEGPPRPHSPAPDHAGLTRRRFLRSAAAAIAVPGLTGCAARVARPEPVPPPAQAVPEIPLETLPPTLRLGPTPNFLPAPDLAQDRVLRYVAGLRPFRRGTVRIEHETVGSQSVVHHYGHGGSGFTLAWGTAEEAADLLERHHPAPKDVAVLGGGVVGLTTAVVLLERGYAVTVYAKALSPNTTSDLAGAQFAPSLVDADSHERLERWVRASARRYLALRGDEYGVYERPNYATGPGGSGLNKLPTDLFPMRDLDELPFPGGSRRGRVHQTLLIEPPTYLPRLLKRVYEAGGGVTPRTFHNAADVAALRERVVVNCMGLGSGEVFPDRALTPVRGQLVLMQPEPLGYLLSHAGYCFPRSDAVVLGGTVERGVDRAQPQPEDCLRILNNHRRFFGQPTAQLDRNAPWLRRWARTPHHPATIRA